MEPSSWDREKRVLFSRTSPLLTVRVSSRKETASSNPTKVRDVVESAVSETTFRQIALKMQKTREIPLSGDPVKAVEVLANRYTLNDTERAGVLRHLIVEGDLTAYGLVNAVTHYSQEVMDYDRATDFEALGGKLIELPASDWREVATAEDTSDVSFLDGFADWDGAGSGGQKKETENGRGAG